MYYVGPGDSEPLAALSIYCLVMGSVTSYARARAESLGMKANVGIAERSDRLVAILVMTGLAGLIGTVLGEDWPLVLIPVTLAALALASTITVVQRILMVRGQAKAARLMPGDSVGLAPRLRTRLSRAGESAAAHATTAGYLSRGGSSGCCRSDGRSCSSNGSPTRSTAATAPACSGCAPTSGG